MIFFDCETYEEGLIIESLRGATPREESKGRRRGNPVFSFIPNSIQIDHPKQGLGFQ
jgi:hypothetical protein